MYIDPQILISAFGIMISFGVLAITYYRWVYLPRNEKKRKKRLNEMMKLQTQRDTYEQCIFDAEQNLKLVNKDDYISFSFVNLGSAFKLFSKVERYKEGFHALSDWLTACKNAIELSLNEIAKEELPATVKEYNFVLLLQGEDIMLRFLFGEEVTKRWIEKTYPSLFYALMKKLKESEKKLDKFFIQINKAFKKHRILKRFRKEKKNLIELGKEIIKDCNEEISVLNGELSEYSDLEDEFKDYMKEHETPIIW